MQFVITAKYHNRRWQMTQIVLNIKSIN